MLTLKSAKTITIVIVLAIAWLVTACSPQADTPSVEDTIPHLNDITRAVSSGSSEGLKEIVQFSSLPCTKADGMGGPPTCLADEAEGTLVEVLPVLGPEGHHIRRSDLGSWPGIGAAQLYAVYQTADSTYSDEFFPAGDYGVAFLLPDKVNVVAFQVTEDGIVRMENHILSSIGDILKNSEVIIGPTPPPD